MIGFMYILECADGSYYTGSTRNINRRLHQHQTGEGANHTKKRQPVRLVYCKYFKRVQDAFYYEKQVQGWSRKKKEALMYGQIDLLKSLSQCTNETHSDNASKKDATPPSNADSTSSSDEVKDETAASSSERNIEPNDPPASNEDQNSDRNTKAPEDSEHGLD